MKNAKYIFIFVLFVSLLVVIDQYIKAIFVNGFTKHFDVMSFILVYNKGIAFSMLANLGDSLKYIQLTLIVSILIYFIYDKEFFRNYFIALCFIIGGGISNVLDRFLHSQGVVDFIYWHHWFDFAVFNTADIFINIGAFLMLLSFFMEYRKSKKEKDA